MTYGFDEDTKEKIPVYSKDESVETYGDVDSRWVGFSLFGMLGIWKNRKRITGVPSGGVVPSVIPAGYSEAGEIALPAELVSKYDNLTDLAKSITISLYNCYDGGENLHIAFNAFNPTITKRGSTHYLNFVIKNTGSSESSFPSVDIVIIANYVVMPDPPQPPQPQ